MKKPGQGGDREDLERYGVWVKADPEDVAEPDTGIDFDVTADIPDMNGIESTEPSSFLTEEEEEILGSVESMTDDKGLESLETEFVDGPEAVEATTGDAPAPSSKTTIDFGDFEVEEIDLPGSASNPAPPHSTASETAADFDSVDMGDFLEEGPSAPVEAFPASEKSKSSGVEEFSVDDFLDVAPSDDSIPDIVQDEDPLDIELEFDDTISDELTSHEGNEGSAEQIPSSSGNLVDFDDSSARAHEAARETRYDEPTEIDIDEIVSIDGPSTGFGSSFEADSPLQIDEGNAMSVHEETPSDISISDGIEDQDDLSVAESFESIDVEVPLGMDDSLRIDETESVLPLSTGSSIDDSVLSEAGFDEIEEISVSEESEKPPLTIDDEPAPTSIDADFETEEDMPIQDSFGAPPEAIDDIAEVEKRLGEIGDDVNRAKSNDSGSTELLLKIAKELEGIKSDIHSIKDELATLKAPSQQTEFGSKSDEEDKAKGFFDEEDDETIALTGDELDNILNTADFTEETGQDSASEVFGEEEPLEANDTVLEEPSQDLSDTQDVLSSIDDEEINLLHEVDVAPMTEQPENLSYLDEESNVAKDDLEPDFGDITMNEPPLEEPNIEEIRFDDTLDDSFDEGTEELPVVLEEPNDEIEELPDVDLEEEPSLQKAPLEEILLNEPRTDSEPSEVVEEVIASDSAGMPADSTRDTSANKSAVVPDSLKDDIKSVLNYMDQLLESLPEEKIEEFARSDHFKVYKRLFEELGLI